MAIAVHTCQPVVVELVFAITPAWLGVVDLARLLAGYWADIRPALVLLAAGARTRHDGPTSV